jgi:hypothetical protein
MTTTGTTYTISNPTGIIVVDPNDNINVLLANLDANNTIYLANTPAVNPGANPSDNIPLAPGGTVVMDGISDNALPWYAAIAEGLSANLAVIPGGVSFFQFVTLLLKTLIVDASLGNGIFVYYPSRGAGNLILSIAGVADNDEYGNPYNQGLELHGVSQLFTLTTENANETTPAIIAVGSVGSGSKQQLLLQLFSPTISHQPVSAVYLFSASRDGTVPPSVMVLGQQLDVTADGSRFAPGQVSGSVTGLPTLTLGGPQSPSDDILAISYDPTNPPNLSSQALVIYDVFGAPIFAVPPAGGPKTFGDFMGVWQTPAGGAVAQFLPWGGTQPSGTTTGATNSGGVTIGGAAMYSGSGAPPNAEIVALMNAYTVATGSLAVHEPGDFYLRTDGVAGSWLYRCTVAGVSGNPGGAWVNMV